MPLHELQDVPEIYEPQAPKIGEHVTQLGDAPRESVQVALTDIEMSEAASRSIELRGRAATLRAEGAALKKEKDAEAAGLVVEAGREDEAFRTGHRPRDVQIQKLLDHTGAGEPRVLFVRADTRQVVRSRAPMRSELQATVEGADIGEAVKGAMDAVRAVLTDTPQTVEELTIATSLHTSVVAAALGALLQAREAGERPDGWRRLSAAEGVIDARANQVLSWLRANGKSATRTIAAGTEIDELAVQRLLVEVLEPAGLVRKVKRSWEAVDYD